MKEQIIAKISELVAQIETHKGKLDQINAVAQHEAKQILAKQGAVEVLKKLLGTKKSSLKNSGNHSNEH